MRSPSPPFQSPRRGGERLRRHLRFFKIVALYDCVEPLYISCGATLRSCGATLHIVRSHFTIMRSHFTIARSHFTKIPRLGIIVGIQNKDRCCCSLVIAVTIRFLPLHFVCCRCYLATFFVLFVVFGVVSTVYIHHGSPLHTPHNHLIIRRLIQKVYDV